MLAHKNDSKLGITMGMTQNPDHRMLAHICF